MAKGYVLNVKTEQKNRKRNWQKRKQTNKEKSADGFIKIDKI
jgi:hypothetical protein